MDWAFVALLMAINYGISVFNAWSVGKVWAERHEAGWFANLMIWSGAVMSACGFVWVYMIIEGLVFHALGKLELEDLSVLWSAGYLVIIIPVLGSGLMLTLNAWIAAWRYRRVRDFGIAGWNTFAQGYNTYQAISGIPDAIKDIASFKGSSRGGSKSGAGILMLVLLLAAIILGIMTTVVIIRWSASRHADKMYEKMDESRATEETPRWQTYR